MRLRYVSHTLDVNDAGLSGATFNQINLSGARRGDSNLLRALCQVKG
jgi:uncharacterized protein YjbI with pentapeptide repeats